MSQMPVGDPIPPTLRKEFDALWREVRALKAPKRKQPGPTFDRKELVFSTGSAPIEDQQSPPFHVSWVGAYISEVKVATRGTGQVTAHVLVNGNSIIQISMTGDDREVEDDLMEYVEEWDLISTKATSVPEGIEAMTIHVILMVPIVGEEE